MKEKWEDQKGTKETMGMKEKWEDERNNGDKKKNGRIKKERKKQWG